MKSTIKKGLLGLGTVAAVAAPIAAVISCGTAKNTINWDGENDKFGELKGSEFLSAISSLGKTKEKAVTIAKEQMMQVQYESESIRSLKAQRDTFKYNVWKNELDIEKLGLDKKDLDKDIQDTEKAIDAEGHGNNNAEIIKNLEAQKSGYKDQQKSIDDSVASKTKENNDTEKFIDKINTAIDGVSFDQDFIPSQKSVTDFFENTYNSTDYPQVYKPLSEIREDKKNIVNDAYRNFYPQFTTREDGDREWPTELAKNYGNAATFSEAIDYLVTNDISEKAFDSFKFDINKTYTVEQKIWSESFDDGKDSFKFLTENESQHSSDIDDDIDLIKAGGTDEATIKENIISVIRGKTIGSKIIETSVLSSPEIFLGSKSPDFRIADTIYNDLNKVVKYQHLLVKATQGKAPNDSWTITADDLTKLMTYKQIEKIDESGNEIKQGIEFIGSDLLFKTDDNNDDTNKKLKDMTDFILKEISGNSEGTITIEGSLGIKPELEYIKTMVPGFSLGNLAGLNLPEEEIDLSVLIKNLYEALKTEVLKSHVSLPDEDAVTHANMDETNTDISATIKDLGDDKVKTIFGRIFGEFFKDKTGLIYKVKDTSNFLVISQFGIHIIKRTPYGDADHIKAALKEDIANMADDSSLPSVTGLATELGNIYTDTKIMDVLLKANGFEAALQKELDEYNKGKDEVDQVELKDVKELIENINKLKARTDVDEAMGDKLENWLVTQYDSGLRTPPTGITLDDIYSWAEKVGE